MPHPWTAFCQTNLILFIAFSGVCLMALALMGDFGTALVFFIAYLTISFIRSGDLATVFLSVAGAGFAGFMAVTLKPHVAARFRNLGPRVGICQRVRFSADQDNGGGRKRRTLRPSARATDG